MNPEREALRLSAIVAFGVGLFIITLSIDNYNQQKLPTRIGQAECGFWKTTFGGCATDIWSVRDKSRETLPTILRL